MFAQWIDAIKFPLRGTEENILSIQNLFQNVR